MKAKPAKPAKPAAAEPPRHRVFIVDDHPMMREGMGKLIDGEPGLMYCGGAGNAEQALSEIERCRPDVVITDVTMPGRGGIELIKDLKVMHPDLPVLVFSMHDESFYAERALRAGARGYLMKEAGSGKMLEAIHHVLRGEICVSQRVSAKILDLFSNQRPRGSSSPIERLTDREFQVYQLIGQGKATKEIADQLHLSHKTVAVHRGNIKEKLNITSATELVRHAVRWVQTEEGANGRER
jgi:DNA-binding NarL/FixJ family response regulator